MLGMDWLLDHISANWAEVMAHPEAFAVIFLAGLVGGWAGAWIILKQRITLHQERVDHYKDMVAGKIGASLGALPHAIRPSPIALPLVIFGAASILIGAVLAYNASYINQVGPCLILVLMGLLLVVFGFVASANPSLKVPDQKPVDQELPVQEVPDQEA